MNRKTEQANMFALLALCDAGYLGEYDEDDGEHIGPFDVYDARCSSLDSYVRNYYAHVPALTYADAFVVWALAWTGWAFVELANTKPFGDWLSHGEGYDKEWPICNVLYSCGTWFYLVSYDHEEKADRTGQA